MASVVDICNLALGHLGDTANVSSIDPPEGSAQAQHCARFYPQARNALLEMVNWNFATRRAILAPLVNTSTEWQFAYAMPSGVIKVIAVHPPDATDDYSQSYSLPNYQFSQASIGGVAYSYTPQPYTIEVNSNEQRVILTNTENAVLRYTAMVTDSSMFSALFSLALSWLLASMLAGPLIKGDAGAAEAKRCYGWFQVFKSEAETSNANQSKANPVQSVPWISGR